MLNLDPLVIGFLAVVANVVVQALKGVLPDAVRKYLPLVIMAVMAAVGLGLALYLGRDPVAGLLEGFFAGASAVGLYEAEARIPGVRAVFHDRGWLGGP